MSLTNFKKLYKEVKKVMPKEWIEALTTPLYFEGVKISWGAEYKDTSVN